MSHETKTTKPEESIDPFIVLDGGLVQNEPGKPVYDFDWTREPIEFDGNYEAALEDLQAVITNGHEQAASLRSYLERAISRINLWVLEHPEDLPQWLEFQNKHVAYRHMADHMINRPVEVN